MMKFIRLTVETAKRTTIEYFQPFKEFDMSPLGKAIQEHKPNPPDGRIIRECDDPSKPKKIGFWNRFCKWLDNFLEKNSEACIPQIGSVWKRPEFPSWDKSASGKVINAERRGIGWVRFKFDDGIEIDMTVYEFKILFVPVKVHTGIE